MALASSPLGCVYLRLRGKLPEDYEVAKAFELFFRWGDLVQTNHFVRMFELFLFISLQLPLHYDSGLVSLDATILMSRISKLNEIFKYDLNHSEGRESQIKLETIEF